MRRLSLDDDNLTNYSQNFGTEQAFITVNSSTSATLKTSLNLFQTSLSGKPAFNYLLKFYNLGDTIWLKVGNYDFYRCTVKEGGEIVVHKTFLDKVRDADGGVVYNDKGKPVKRRVLGSVCPGGYDFLRRQSEIQEGGLFYIPGGAPLKIDCIESDDIGAEMDDGTFEEQAERIHNLAKEGLEITDATGSGGKSIHGHVRTTEKLPIELRNYFARLLAIALVSDPAVTSSNQPMRFGGFFRKEKGREQLVYPCNGKKYSAEELADAFKKVFEGRGWKFPTLEELNQRWSKINGGEILKSDKPYSQKLDLIKLVLEEEIEVKEVRKLKEFDLSEYDGKEVHIFNCLGWGTQYDIKHGAKQGSIRSTSFKIAKDLIGTANYLKSKGFKYVGSEEELYEQFCERCDPPFGEHEAKEQWEDAEKADPTPTQPENKINSLFLKKDEEVKEERLIEPEYFNRLRVKKEWYKLNFTPVQTSRGKELNPEEIASKLPKQCTVFCDAIMGKGKSETAIATKNLFPDYDVIAINPTVALNRDLAEKLQLDTREEWEAKGTLFLMKTSTT